LVQPPHEEEKMKTASLLFLVTLFAPAALGAQGVPLPPQLPGSAQPPQEIREMEQRERQARPDPVRRVTREHALEALERIRPGATSPENLTGTPLPASARPPAEIAEMEARERQARAARDPGETPRRQLIDKLKALPGGAERIEAARRQGAPISATTGRLRSAIAFAMPFRVREAWASTSDFSVTLTPTSKTSTNPLARLSSRGSNVFPGTDRIDLWPGTIGLDRMQHRRDYPFVWFHVEVPARGWYIINFRGLQYQSSARLVHGGTVVASWDYSGGSWEDYPTVLLLSAGEHYFQFVNTRYWVEVASATAFSL
jgi:hypothetical protein